MEHKTLSVELRNEFGKGPAGRMRSEGKIPAVIYGAHDNRNITVNEREFTKKFKTISENTIITLDFGKDSCEVLIKDFQEDIVRSRIDHLDFYEIEKGKKLKTHVPVVLTGNSPGVKEGGILVQKISEVEVECLPKDLPEQIEVNLDGLDVGHSIHVGDIAGISGVTIMASENQTIVVVNHPKGTTAASTEEDEEEVVAGEEE
ncbi:50S ribosomal protein L25 [Spirochaeta isovalerica]|uniref:Large ribosomal subunit protein bL25 n=1 Tax=Spirochaeta isovalerica TaxID=150 RepID=A0A841R7K3_9SPIO|nr:50S ribosomal protein L25 [Spirochaeta isovalerica]MBB6479020.1 large subunit ribosomal protein L25 [Spirochaeta isovalerica]